MLSIRLSFLLFSLLFCLQLPAKDIYITPTGNDQNPGTKAKPLASLQGARNLIRNLRAKQAFNEPVRVVIADGTYYMTEPLLLTGLDSGSEQSPVCFRAEKGASPQFVGGIAIENWEEVSEGLWKARVDEVSRYGLWFEQLYVDGHSAIRAKSPNRGFYTLKEVSEHVVAKGKDRVPRMAVQKFRLTPETAEAFSQLTKSDFDDAIVTFYHAWDNTRKRISSYDADSLVFYTAGEGMKSWNPIDKKSRFLLENYKAALDTCGEWYLDRGGELFYRPLPGEDIARLRVVAPVARQLVVLQGTPVKPVSHVRFEGLRFEATGYRMPLWGNEAAQAAAPIDAAIMADFASQIAFTDCEISQVATHAFWFRRGCSDCTIARCYLHDLGAGGIKLGDTAMPKTEEELTRRMVVDNNIIRTGGSVFPCGVGVILFHSADNQITHNEIANFRYSGISVGWVWGYSPSPSKRNIIEYNHIHHLGWGELCDMGGVYCLGASEGTSVSHNVIHHIYSFEYGGWGLYTDEGSTGILMENNLVYLCKNSGFHQHYGKENTIRNNIFAANLQGQLQATRIEPHLSFHFTQNIVWFSTGTLLSSNWNQINLDAQRNAYWDTRTDQPRFGNQSFAQWQAAGKDAGSVIEDPQFADPARFDFRVNNRALIEKIGFKPFDPTRAGVYGNPEWIELARFDETLAKRFDALMR